MDARYHTAHTEGARHRSRAILRICAGLLDCCFSGSCPASSCRSSRSGSSGRSCVAGRKPVTGRGGRRRPRGPFRAPLVPFRRLHLPLPEPRRAARRPAEAVIGAVLESAA
jgi:hypothetical protein